MVEKLENSIITSFSLKSTRAKYSRVTLVINYNNSNRKKKENQQIEKCKMLLSNAKLRKILKIPVTNVHLSNHANTHTAPPNHQNDVAVKTETSNY